MPGLFPTQDRALDNGSSAWLIALSMCLQVGGLLIR